MNARTKCIFCLCTVLWLLSACMATRPSPRTMLTLLPPLRLTPTPIPPPRATMIVSPMVTAHRTPTPTSTALPTVVPGSRADFYRFAIEIGAALEDGRVAFFEDHAAASVWDCHGQKGGGVCKGVPAGTTLEGILVTPDWMTYEIYPLEDYLERWQAVFDSRALQLAAVASNYEQEPPASMAMNLYQAIVSIPGEEGPGSVQEVRVLLFEYSGNAWHLTGEVATVDQVDAWLGGSCGACYDTWVAWEQ